MAPYRGGMRVELYGIARARAGREAVEVRAGELGAVLARLVEACPGLAPEVVDGARLTSGYLASINGECFLGAGDAELAESDTLVILGAQAGG